LKRLIIIILCALMLLALSVTERSTPEKDAAASEELPPLSGEPMSDFPETVGDLSFNTLTVDGREIRAGVIREYDLVIINCWADWCGPCVGELPALARIHREYPNVLIIGLLCNPTGIENVKAIMQAKGVSYPVVEPAGSLIDLVKRFDAIPATVFFDSTGHEIANPIVGARSYAAWKTIVEDLLP
jgi:thiol-disulfide isomerase/thioredoxin